MRLEAGKTYVFKDDECKDNYLNGYPSNLILYTKYYKEGYTLDGVDDNTGWIKDEQENMRLDIILEHEVELFKEKTVEVSKKYIQSLKAKEAILKDSIVETKAELEYLTCSLKDVQDSLSKAFNTKQ